MAGNLVQGALFTVMVVRAGMLRDAAFAEELQQQVGRSPRFFLNAPAAITQSARPPARLVTEPVRSGTQIYAQGTDLIVTAAVSAGAELVADGHIHVYGALRGRALAGAGGDVEARIFCSRLEAELVSIAGRYLVSEQLPPEQRGSAVHIALVDDQLTVTKN